MPHNVQFLHGLHSLLSQNRSSEKEVQYNLEIITSDPSLYTVGHPDLTVSKFMENSIGFKRVSCLFIAALWSPEGKGLISWLLFVMFIAILLLSHLVSWDRCGT